MRPWDDWEWLAHCGEQTCNCRHYVPPHHHTTFEFFYVQRGQAIWEVGETTFVQEPGMLFIAHPKERHGSVRRTHAGYHSQFLGLNPEALGEAGVQLVDQLRAEAVHLLSHCQDVEPLLRGLMQQALTRESGCCDVAMSYLRTFVALLQQRLAAQRLPHTGEQQAPYSYPIQKAVHFMSENLDRRLTLAEMAAVAGYGVSQFCLRFGEEVGISPAAYHLDLRLQAARHALRQPNCTVTLVAYAYGFSSTQHFTTAFQNVFGITPSRWQRVGGSQPLS